jgi:ribonuclease HI
MPPIDINEYDNIDAVRDNLHLKINTRTIQPVNKNQQSTLTAPSDTQQLQDHITNPQHWHHDITTNTKILRNDILLESEGKKITISTDGGATQDKGSFGVVNSMEEIIIATNKSRLPPIHNLIHSYRSEGFGILGGLIIYKEMYEYCKNKQTNISTDITIKSDGKSMIDKINKIRYWRKTQKQCNKKDMDVISEIINILNELYKLKITVQLKYVKGHQDRITNNLTTEAQLNVVADTLATEGLRLRNIKEKLILSTDDAIITLHGKVITANRTKILRDAFQSIQLREYLKMSNNWNDCQIEKIWWKVHEKSLQTISQSKKLIITKFNHSQLPCNHRNNIMYEYKPPYCTLCTNIVEDQSHVLRCTKCPERAKIRDKFKKDLLRLLVNTNTDTAITRILTATINAWLNQVPIPSVESVVPDASEALKQAIQFQNQIGWENIFKGRLDIAWGEMYNHQHTTETTSDTRKLVAESWGTKIITLFWDFVLEMWLARNEIEHNLDSKHVDIHKRKLVEHISWIKQKIDEKVVHPYKNTSDAELQALPTNNLKIMLDQIQNIYHKHRLNPEDFDIT